MALFMYDDTEHLLRQLMKRFVKKSLIKEQTLLHTRRIRSRTGERGASPRPPEFEGASNSRNADRLPAIFGRF